MSIKCRLMRLEKKAGIGNAGTIRTLKELLTYSDRPNAKEYKLSPQLVALLENANCGPESNENG